MAVTSETNTINVYKRLLKQLHSTFETPKDIRQEVIKSATGYYPLRDERIINGESNEIYSVLLPHNEEVIMKISRDKKKNFKKDRWIGEQCYKLSLPVPRVLYLNEYTVNDEELIICIQEKLQGRALNQLLIRKNSNKIKYRSVIESLGELLSKIHSIETAGYWALDGKGTGSSKKWSDYMLDPILRMSRFQEITESLHINEYLMDYALYLLEEYTDIYDDVPSRLVYGDLDPRNILVKNYTITGLIDFEDAMSGDPILDFARWDYFSVFHRQKASHLVTKYGSKDLFSETFILKFHLYRLRFGLHILDYFEPRNNIVVINAAKYNLEKDVKTLLSPNYKYSPVNLW